jgi:hypothetical protein
MTTPGLRENGREVTLVQPAPPDIDEATAARIARDEWGVTGRARALGSHQDRNFLIEPEGAPRVLLTIANPSVSAAELEAQSAAAAAITAAGVRARRALRFADGTTARAVVVDGVTMQARLLELPDVIAVAKARENGHPLGAVITTRQIAERYRTGGYFFSSAGGSPVSSVIGSTVLDVIRDDRLQQNARETGGDHQNILKIKPPMCFTRESADALVTALDRVLTTGW